MTEQPRWRQVGGNAAEVYARQLVPAMFAPWVPGLLELAALRPGERVLDVACGSGVVAHAAAARVGRAGRVVGLDVNGALLAVAAALPPEGADAAGRATVEWLEADALAMPLPDAAFDVVLCQQGLQQLPDPLAGLREMRRVLRDGGRLALSVWSRLEGSPGMAALVAALERHVGTAAANNRRAPFALADAGRLRELLVGAGFGAVEVRTLVEPARFASPEALVEAQLAATPLATLGALDDAARAAVNREVRAACAPWLDGARFSVPMEAHVALAVRG